MRLWIVNAVCRILGHPTRAVKKDGVRLHECPCGHLLFSDRPPSE